MKLQVEMLWKLNDKLDSHETRLAQHQKHAAEIDERLESVATLVELRHVPAPLPPPAERAPSKVHVSGPRDCAAWHSSVCRHVFYVAIGAHSE